MVLEKMKSRWLQLAIPAPAWFVLFVSTPLLFMIFNKFSVFGTILPIFGILAFVFAIIFPSIRLSEVQSGNSFSNNHILLLILVSFSAITVEIGNQISGNWPSVFWTDLLLVCIFSFFLLFEKMSKYQKQLEQRRLRCLYSFDFY